MKKQLLILLLIPLGSSAQILLEDATKKIETINGNNQAVIISLKDDTGNDQESVKGKAELATDTTCNVFRLLRECGIPVAFYEQLSDTKFAAPKCSMVLYQVTARRQASGSYLNRNPHIKPSQLFPRLLIEFFLKTSDKKWQNYCLPYENPYIQFRDNKALLYDPKKPVWEQTSILGLNDYPLKGDDQQFMKMIEITARTFLVLEKAWQLAGGSLIDLNLEFGIDSHGNLLLADVIDNSSWNIIHDSESIDKQFYRDGATITKATKNNRYVRDRTAEFRLPKQQIIIWRGSEKDDVQPFLEYLKPYIGKEIAVTMITCPMHKDPITGYKTLLKTVQNIPDCVVVAFVDRANATGPMISANTLVPTITVPTGWKEFPDDIWSSLRNTTDVPVMTMLDPANAALAALQISTRHNPRLYCLLQMQSMSRLQNIFDV